MNQISKFSWTAFLLLTGGKQRLSIAWLFVHVQTMPRFQVVQNAETETHQRMHQLLKPQLNVHTVTSYLTFLQYCGFADLLCSHCKFRLLLAGGHYGLEIIVAFLKLNTSQQRPVDQFLKKKKTKLSYLSKGERDQSAAGHRDLQPYLDSISSFLLSLCVRLSSSIFIRVFVWRLMSVVTVLVIYSGTEDDRELSMWQNDSWRTNEE